MLDCEAYIIFKGSAKQDLTRLAEGMAFEQPIRQTSAAFSPGTSIPLSSFSFSCSLGVQPSNGSCQISGAYLTINALKNSNLEDVEISVASLGTDVGGAKEVRFKKLRVVDFSYSPVTAPEGHDRIYTVNFQDKRWRLRKGAIFGHFNRTERLLDKIRFIVSTIKEDKTPWTYMDLIEKAAEMAGVEIQKPELLQEFGVGPWVLIEPEALDRLDEFPLNKKYEGLSPADVIADLLKDIDFSLTIKPDGSLILCPLIARLVAMPDKEVTVTSSSAGAKHVPVPDKVYLVGGRKRDQILILPDLNAYGPMISEFLGGLSGDLEFQSITSTFTGSDANPYAIPEGAGGLEPVCYDIAGNIVPFYELIKDWDVSIVDASIVYQSQEPAEGKWRDLLSQTDITNLRNLRGLPALEEEEAQKKTAVDETREWSPGETALISGLKTELKQIRSQIRQAENWIKEQQENDTQLFLSEEEQAFLADHPDFDVLETKVKIAQQYFFRLYRIPEKVLINYQYSTDEEELRLKYVPDAFVGEEKVPRSYVLPFVPFIDEYRDDTKAEKDEGGAQETESQADKGKSESEKKKPSIDFIPIPMKKKIPIRIWCYGYEKDVKGVWGFSLSHTFEKEVAQDAYDVKPEQGLIFIHKAPYLLANFAGLSEDCPFIPWGCPVGCEIAYDRKDPRLGLLNFYVKKLEKPEIIKAEPPSRSEEEKVIIFEQIDEFVDILLDGVSVKGDDLDKLAEGFAGEIWAKAAGLHSWQARSSVPAVILAFPFGPLQTVSWSTGPFTTTFEINTDYQAFSHTTLTDRIGKALKEKGLYHRSETEDQLLSYRRGFFSVDQTARFLDDDRRLLINVPHIGPFCMYDPDEREDVLAVSARLLKPVPHYHRKWWLGPLLCREPAEFSPGPELQQPIALYGHFWFTPNQDRCLVGGHRHNIGGYYFPYVYMPADATPSPIIKNPIKGRRGDMPRAIRLDDEGATGSTIKAENFTDGGSGSGDGDGELLGSELKNIPQDINGNDMSTGLLVEYCIASDPGAATSATFAVEIQLMNKDETYDAPRTQSGYYVLPLADVAAFTLQRQLICDIGNAQDYDQISMLFQRSHNNETEDLFRDSVFITDLKIVHGWNESQEQVATFPP